MIFQDELLLRTIVVFTVQLIVSILFIFIGYRILSRKRTLITITLSLFHLILASAYLLVVCFFWVRIDGISWTLYSISLFLSLLSPSFLVLFCVNFLEYDIFMSLKIQLLYLIIYAIGLLIIINIPNYIQFSSSTGWVPIFSWEAYLTLMTVYTLMIVIPLTYSILKISKMFKDKKIKSRILSFLIGTMVTILTAYGAGLYNVLIDFPMYRIIWSVISNLLLICFFLIYYGIGKEL